MDTETSLTYHKLVEERATEDSIVPLDTLLGWLKELLLGPMSIHIRRKALMKSFGRLGSMGRMGMNTGGYITEIS